MKIIENGVRSSRTTTLNDIPVGTTFRGVIIGPRSGLRFSGIFFKVDANFMDKFKNSHDVCVVCLDKPGATQYHDKKYSNSFLSCAEVVEYEPLDVELVIKGVL